MFNEDSRVKIPALVHLTRLGYKYISRSDVKAQADPDTNILKDVFSEQIKRLNPNIDNESSIERLLQDIKLELDYDDLGREFFKRLKGLHISVVMIKSVLVDLICHLKLCIEVSSIHITWKIT